MGTDTESTVESAQPSTLLLPLSRPWRILPSEDGTDTGRPPAPPRGSARRLPWRPRGDDPHRDRGQLPRLRREPHQPAHRPGGADAGGGGQRLGGGAAGGGPPSPRRPPHH